MELLQINKARCSLCQVCVEQCPFQALTQEGKSIQVNANCKMCGICVKSCPEKAITAAEKSASVDKSQWQDILVFAEFSQGEIHPVALELVGEGLKLAENVDYKVSVVAVGGSGTEEKAKELAAYGVDRIFVYEDPAFSGFRADCYTSAVADCIEEMKPSVVLVGATPLGRALAPRLSTRFQTGLTADCTQLAMKENTDLVQIRPAFGGNIMAEITIENHRPQFATVRYKVMDKAKKVSPPTGRVIKKTVTEEMRLSGAEILETHVIQREKSIEEEDVLVVAGRGVKDEKGLEMVRKLAEALGGQLCYTRPMTEAGIGDTAHQIGLSGRTVKPKLIITCGVSGAIQFASCMVSSECIIAINNDPQALIFNIANYCVKDDLYQVVPRLIERIQQKGGIS